VELHPEGLRGKVLMKTNSHDHLREEKCEAYKHPESVTCCFIKVFLFNLEGFEGYRGFEGGNNTFIGINFLRLY